MDASVVWPAARVVVITGDAVTCKEEFGANAPRCWDKPSFDQSLLARVRALPAVADATGSVVDEAVLLDRGGKPIHLVRGAPHFGFSVDPSHPKFNSLTLASGAWPKDGQVVVDQWTARSKAIVVGQRINVRARGGVKQLRVSGLIRLGAPIGATLAGFSLKTAQKLFKKVGRLDAIRAAGKTGVDRGVLLRQINRILPRGTIADTAP